MGEIYSSSSGEPVSFSPLWTFLCRRKFETTEKCRPQPSTSHANAAKTLLVHVSNGGVAVRADCLSGWVGRMLLTLLAGVAIHVSLERRRACESLVADLALMLLLSVGRHFGAKLAHHGLGAGGCTTGQKTCRSGQSAGLIGLGCCGAVVGHGRVD